MPKIVETQEESLSLEPFETGWEGSTWIIPGGPEYHNLPFPGYRGFHLSRDGRLLLIGLNSAIGDTWSANDNHLNLKLIEGVAELPIEGSFLAFIPEETVEDSIQMQLVPENQPDAVGLIFQRASINIDIIENLWIPRFLDGGQNVMWPMNREIHLMLLPNSSGGLGVLGYGGENRFSGDVNLGKEEFSIGPLSATRRIGPGSDFENLFMRRIKETTRYIQVENDLFLYNETRPAASFRVQLFD